MTVTLFGIPNCDTVRKARRWLDERGVPYAFHDYRTAGVPDDGLARWVDAVGWEALLNRRGTTFRALPDAARADLDAATAQTLMIAHPAAIKRPVVDTGSGDPLVGFDPASWADRFA